ncbi:MAG TPA: hypothetical protein VFY45_18405 [Baekduia sp.]|nr:hypothetical protein [Baekduia sp.]
MFAPGAAVAAGVLAAVALGQEGGPIQMTATVRVKPNEAGTPSRPRGIEIVAQGTIDVPPDTARPVARSFDVWLPKGWVYNGAKHPVCALATLNAKGPGACPPESIMGHGELGRRDPGIAYPAVVRRNLTVVNGGANKMYFWVMLSIPARVQAAIPGTVTKVNSSRWSYRLHADNPSSLQIVSGIPVTLNYLYARFGRGDWIATTSCPRDRLWRYRLRMTSTSGHVLETDGSVPCRS